jgi:hypothetical protein
MDICEEQVIIACELYLLSEEGKLVKRKKLGSSYAVYRGLEKALSEWHGRGTAGARHGHAMACVNQIRLHCVNQMEKTQSKP